MTALCNCSTAYAILKVECMRQATPRAGAATRALTELGQPSLDWVSLAAGMGVPGRRCATVGELEEALRAVLPAGSGDSSSAAAAAAGAAAAAPATAAGAGGARGTINTAAAAPPHTGPFLIHAMLS